MSQPNWMRSGFFTILDRFFALFFGFGSLILLLRILTKDMFGEWVLFTTITSFIEVGRVGLLQNALVRFINTAPDDEHPRIQTAALLLNAGLSLVAVLLLWGLSLVIGLWWHLPELATLLRIYALTTFVLTALYQSMFLQLAALDYRGLFLVSFVRQGLFFVFAVFLYWFRPEFSLASLAWAQLVIAVPALLISWQFVKKLVRLTRTIDRGWLRQLGTFGLYNCGTNLATMSYKSVDKWVLESRLQNAALVGSYELAVRITNLVEAPTFAMATILFPQSARRMAEQDTSAVRDLYEKSVGVILSLILPFILFIWLSAPYLVHLIGGAQYAESTPVLRWTVLYGLFIPFAVQFGTVLDSIGRPQVNFAYTLTSALVNLLCNWIFIRQFGLMGAAYGTLFSFALIFVLMQAYLYKHLGVRFWRVALHIFPFYTTMALQVLTKIRIKTAS